MMLLSFLVSSVHAQTELSLANSVDLVPRTVNSESDIKLEQLQRLDFNGAAIFMTAN